MQIDSTKQEYKNTEKFEHAERQIKDKEIQRKKDRQFKKDRQNKRERGTYRKGREREIASVFVHLMNGRGMRL